jgi:hypothetical protein
MVTQPQHTAFDVVNRADGFDGETLAILELNQSPNVS